MSTRGAEPLVHVAAAVAAFAGTQSPAPLLRGAVEGALLVACVAGVAAALAARTRAFGMAVLRVGRTVLIAWLLGMLWAAWHVGA